MRRPALPLLVLAVVACALLLAPPTGASPGAARVPTPRALCKALRSTAFPPSRYRARLPVLTSPSVRAARHHVVCEVEVAFDTDAYVVFYVVFPRRVDAVSNFDDGIKGAVGVVRRSAAPTMPQPALILNGRSNGVGTTVVGSVSRYVDVVALTTNRVPGATSGNVAVARALATLAVAHLKALLGTG